MLWWLLPLRPPRRSCGATAGLQAVVFTVAAAAVVVLVALGNPLDVAAPMVAGLVALVIRWRCGPAGGEASQERTA